MTGPADVPRAALEDALEGLEEMYPYVPEQFQWKHYLDEYIARARAVLAGEPDPTVEARGRRTADAQAFLVRMNRLRAEREAEQQ